MTELKFSNTNKNPNKLHDFLIQNNIIPTRFIHDRSYDELGVVLEEAKTFFITVQDKDIENVLVLIEQFLQK
ncbi:hypothetical protein ACNQFZ_18585 [Schinkia sp. CFF1]